VLLLLIYQLIVAGFLGTMLVIMLLNFILQKGLSSYGSGRSLTADAAPFVSVLIPARNEASNIARCVRSLLNQDYPNYEIIVLDDHSEDATATIVETLQKPNEDPQGRLRLVRGEDLPSGWLGKNWACWQLSQHAEGQYLLFVDADTWHNQNALRCSIFALHEENAHFFSVFPRQEAGTISERIIVPFLLRLYIYGLLPIWRIPTAPQPSISAGCGQYMFFEREAYNLIGGHEAVKDDVIEDIDLARRMKQFGYRILLPDGRDIITCRMYNSLSGVWNGFSKNLYAFFGYELRWLLLFLAINLLIFVAPFGWLIAGLLTEQGQTAEWFWLPLAQIIISLVMRFFISIREGYSPLDAFWQPFSVLFLCALAYNSVRVRRRGLAWKGRRL
jgi:chlorobactene glucosyltransferase